MNKIKLVGVFIFVLSITLALFFNTISEQNRVNTAFMSMINEQKSYTQEISKSILYLYKNRGSSTEQLDSNIEKFLANMAHKKEDSPQHDVLVKLWNEFYADVRKFRKELGLSTAYSSITIDALVNDIYQKNQKLIVEFNTFLDNKQKRYEETMEGYKNIEYILFLLVFLLLIYLFTQVREIIAFIQRFTTTSETIIQEATIKDLKPMKIRENAEALKEATQNFNHLVEKIDMSIVYAQESIVHTTIALEEVEKKIEDLMTLIFQMQDEESDTLSQKEDAVIDSLETLMNLRDRLKDLHKDLDKLTSSKNNH
jgi:predicted PurR-regulated permease PerM